MKILIDMGHPAHVHLFKNFIWEMQKQGHEFKITARDKDVTKQLLDAYKIPYELVGKMGSGKRNLFLEWIDRDIKIFFIARKFKPDLLMGNLNPAIVHAAKLLGKKSIVFTDSEPEAIKYPIADWITTQFADVILTLSSVRHDYGKKEVRVNSYKELAYLHPNWFKPNPAVLEQAGLTEEDNFILLRFVAWGAYHDVDRSGFDLDAQRKLIAALEPYGRVFISSERPLPGEFEKYRVPIRPEQMHDFLYYAKLLVCDSQTMATEAAILGTPAVRCNSFVGRKDMGNFLELEHKYGLIFNFKDGKKAMEMAVNLIKNNSLKDTWKGKRARIFQKKIDISAFMVRFIENDPWTLHNLNEFPEEFFHSCKNSEIYYDDLK